MKTEDNIDQRYSCFVENSFLFILVFTFYFILSNVLGISPEGIVSKYNDIVFSNDASLWLERLKKVNDFSELSLRHPLRNFIWIPLIQNFALILNWFQFENSIFYSAFLLNLTIMSGSVIVANLWMIHILVPLQKRLIILIVFILASSNIILLAPDHFAISFFFMFLSFYLAFRSDKYWDSILWQIPIMLLIVGTTSSNIVFCGLVVIYLAIKHDVLSHVFTRKSLPYWLVLGTVFFILVIFYFYSRWDRLTDPTNFTLRWLNFRLIDEPLSSLYYSVASFFYPIVAPFPSNGADHLSVINKEHLCLEHWSFKQITSMYFFAISSLLVLFYFSTKQMWSQIAHKQVWFTSVIWVLFNCIFHNLWGDEYFLYTPHWSFSILILLFFAGKKLNTLQLLLLSSPILLNQVYFFYVSHNTIHSISNTF